MLRDLTTLAVNTFGSRPDTGICLLNLIKTGKITLATRLDDGLDMHRVSCPVGVICIIFEARPECCVQISSLCLKSGMYTPT